MKSTSSKFFILSQILWLLANCVSVKIAGTGDTSKRAVGVQFADPGAPFERDTDNDIDAAWKNPKNGNLISYLSDCKDSTDPSLDSIVQGAVAGLASLRVEGSQKTIVQGREAHRMLASGKVDGVPSKIDLLVFKRNQCIYILSYVGVEKAFDLNHAQFDKFMAGFRAP